MSSRGLPSCIVTQKLFDSAKIFVSPLQEVRHVAELLRSAGDDGNMPNLARPAEPLARLKGA